MVVFIVLLWCESCRPMLYFYPVPTRQGIQVYVTDMTNRLTNYLSSMLCLLIMYRALWWIGGAVFYTIHEDVSVPKGLYMSTSIGYGIFWIELKGDAISNIYSTFHFLIGIGVITAAMSLLAQNLLAADKNW